MHIINAFSQIFRLLYLLQSSNLSNVTTKLFGHDQTELTDLYILVDIVTCIKDGPFYYMYKGWSILLHV